MEKKIGEIVNRTTKEILKEISKSQKKRNVKDFERVFRKHKGGFNGIRCIVVLTAENPDSQKHSPDFNWKQNHNLLDDIKSGGYAYVPAIGKFGNEEHPYAVFNMSIETAKHLCGKYQQTSFVYTELNDNVGIHSEYWEKANPTLPYNEEKNNYIKKDECDEWNDMSDADDYFTIVGKKFKYSIPFSIFESTDKLITSNLRRIIKEGVIRNGTKIDENKMLDFSINGCGISPYYWRKTMIKGFYN